MDVQVNFLAVVLAMLSSMVVGSVWYARSVFGKTWMKLTKVSGSGNRNDVWKPIAVAVVVGLITAYVLAHVAYIANQFYHNSFLTDTIVTGLWLWLGFTASRLVMHDAFEGRPIKLTALNAAHELVTIVIMAVIIGAMGY
jgi:hypothetical protein